MEVRDLINKKINCNLTELEMAAYTLSPKAVKDLADAFMRGIPFEYLIGKSEFFYHEFFVNRHVLIPRPETEYLVDMVVREFKNKVDRVLDVGTGSGVILLSLLSHGVGKTGVGVDISEHALDVAAVNAMRLNLQKKTTLLKSDRLDKVEGTFDLIISNPPYIKASSHRSLVHKNVDKYEPHEALYLPDDYYTFWFEDFFAEIRSHLKGTFFMEGHELEIEGQAAMLTRLGFQNVKVLADLTGTKRFVRATF